MRVCIWLAQSVFFDRYLNRFFHRIFDRFFFWKFFERGQIFWQIFGPALFTTHQSPIFLAIFCTIFFTFFLPFKISKVIKSYMFLKKMAHSFYVAFLRASIWVGYKLLFEASRGKLLRNRTCKTRICYDLDGVSSRAQCAYRS